MGYAAKLSLTWKQKTLLRKCVTNKAGNVDKGQDGETLRFLRLPTAERQRCTMYLTTRHKRNLFKYTIDPLWSRATESKGRSERDSERDAFGQLLAGE